ncbi:hypothetical protein KQ298_11635, partial [Synechococcus sp. CS-1330]|nr:hypothetical protein [Synechococcus sp. CS-1330]
LKNQPKVAEHETKSPQKMASEAILGQRHSFLLTASAQAPFVQRFPKLISKNMLKEARAGLPGPGWWR